MATTKDTILGWLKVGQSKGATHVIVACDTFNHDDYPVYVLPSDDVQEKFEELDDVNMQEVMEVYNLGLDIPFQLNEHRAFHF